MKKKGMNISKILWITFLAIFAATLLVNFGMGNEIAENLQRYQFATVLDKIHEIDCNELFIYLLWQRLFLLVVFFVLIYIVPSVPGKLLFMLITGSCIGVLVSVGTICNGIASIYELGLLLFPHMLFYWIGGFTAICKREKWGNFITLFFLFFMFLAGVLSESYLNPALIRILIKNSGKIV